jgi:hypothetical protein
MEDLKVRCEPYLKSVWKKEEEELRTTIQVLEWRELRSATKLGCNGLRPWMTA